jgi:cytidylate kinase
LEEETVVIRLSEGSWPFVSAIERWALLRNIQQKLVRPRPDTLIQEPYRFITITRDIGALGEEIAEETAARLQWKVYDKEIADSIAENCNIRHDLVAQLDERAQSSVKENVERWFSTLQGRNCSNDEYHSALIENLKMLAREGRSILLGHGGAYALQKLPGLHVRITASLPVRVRRLSERRSASTEEARRIAVKTDLERREFVRRHFATNREDAAYFHMSINTDRIPVNYAVAAIVSVIEQSRQNRAKLHSSEFRNIVFRDWERI